MKRAKGERQKGEGRRAKRRSSPFTLRTLSFTFHPSPFTLRLSPFSLRLLLFLAIAPCFAQQPQKWTESFTHRHYGIRDGLVQSQVVYTFQDDYGYMWFSTYNGVSRFDGLHFENYSMKDLKIDSRVRYIAHYENAVYMIAGNSIVFIYPDHSMEFYPFLDDYHVQFSSDRQMPIIGNHIYLFNCVKKNRQNTNYFSLLRFDLKNKTYSILSDDLPMLVPYVQEKKIYALHSAAIKEQKLPLYRLDKDILHFVSELEMETNDHSVAFTKTRRNELFGFLVKGMPPEQITCHLCRYFIENDTIKQEYIAPLPSGFSGFEWLDEQRYIMCTSQKLILDMDDRSLTPFPLDTRYVHFAMVDRDGSIWFSADDGAYHCTQNFMEYRLGLSRNDDIWSVIRDSQGNVWFSSYSHGFWRVDRHGGLHRIDLVYQQEKVPNRVAGYMSNCKDSRGRIFLTFSEGLAVYDPQKNMPNQLDVIRTGVSLAVYYDDANDAVYFGGNNDSIRTLNVLNANGKLLTFPFDYRYPISICRDANKNIRVGTFYGEGIFDEKNGIFVEDTVSRPYQSIICMALDEYGTLWKGTREGLFAEDRQGNDLQIASQTTNFVLNYRNLYIIFGTGNNLHLLDLNAFRQDGNIQIHTFGYYDGFNVIECGQNGASIDHEGFVWVTGNDRVIRFLPEQIMKTPLLQPHTPYLSAIYKADRSSEWQLTSVSNKLLHKIQISEIELENKDNHLRFDLLQASLSAPDKLMFRYRLIGYDDHWHITRERSIIFQNLSHGKYRLEVQSSVDERQWSESVFSPMIVIKPPFILSFPGLLLIALGIIAVGVLFVYYTRKIILRHEDKKRKIDRLTRLAIRAKFIPHFTGNVLNSINYLIQKKPHEAQRYVSDFSDFANITLRNSDSLFRSVKEELEYASLYLKLEKLRFEERLEYDVLVETDVNIQATIPCMIVQTFCENALKHGLSDKPEGGKITIRVFRQNDFTVVSVEDDGVGRKKAKTLKTNSSGEGLKIVQQQLDILNKNKSTKAYMQITDLYEADGQPSGMRVEVWIPNR